MEKLADLGFDPEMGARQLRRVIQQKVEDPLSDALLSGEFQDCSLILVDMKDDGIVLRRGEDEVALPPEEAVPAV